MDAKNYIRKLAPRWAAKHLRDLHAHAAQLLIEARWAIDRAVLPLTEQHKSLYVSIQRLCWHELGRPPNLRHCTDFNDHIQWLKLFDQTREHVRCSDKISVRDYVAERVGPQYLTEIYRICDHYDDIAFNRLPNAFVLKTNHDSGSTVLVRDKAELNHDRARQHIEGSLSRTYGVASGEWAYSLVRPQVLVERLLTSKNNALPPDYKFHCVNGRIKWLQYIYDRGNATKEVIVSPSGEPIDCHFDHKMISSRSFKKPATWAELCDVAEALAKGWKYVRIDLYTVSGNVLFGEMTFFPLAGCYLGAGQKALGPLLNFDRTWTRVPVYKVF
jgi:hypothetical protein